jgi:deoxyribose-phosphate aldolase
MSDGALARRAMRLLDLTDLSETCSDQAIDALCMKALTPHGPVAAVCVWPQFVSRARLRLQAAPVAIATVANFPRGEHDLERILDDAAEALADGATEIDLVMPYRAFQRGEVTACASVVRQVRSLVDGGRRLKVILETGALADVAAIEAASRLAIDEGADFLKTSTGKMTPAATPQAAAAMLRVIRDSRRPVGLKPSGGIRTLSDAAAYLDLADRMIGPGWATPATFRFGASGLYEVLVTAIDVGKAAAGRR